MKSNQTKIAVVAFFTMLLVLSTGGCSRNTLKFPDAEDTIITVVDSSGTTVEVLTGATADDVLTEKYTPSDIYSVHLSLYVDEETNQISSGACTIQLRGPNTPKEPQPTKEQNNPTHK